MITQPKKYDVAIVGAGPGGSTTAYHLARRGMDVLLLDKVEFPRDKTCGDGLSPRAVAVLETMGVLDDLQPESQRVNRIEIWSPAGYSVQAEVPLAPGLPDYALVTPRFVLDDAIRQRAVGAGAAFRGGVRVVDINVSEGAVHLEGRDGQRDATYRASLAVLATGASLRLQKRLGLLSQPPELMLAARAYYEGVAGLDGNLQFRFDGVPLPGYGWVFPLGGSRANIGAGYTRRGGTRQKVVSTVDDVFRRFIEHPPLQGALRAARRLGPVKGYPLRVDFSRASTYGQRLLMLGEAAGLVNPLTGEGLDNALESAVIAADHLADMFEAGDLSHGRLAAYDAALRRRFQRQFIFCGWVRDLLLNRIILDHLVKLAGRRPDLKMGLIKIALGYPDSLGKFTFRRIVAAFLGG